MKNKKKLEEERRIESPRELLESRKKKLEEKENEEDESLPDISIP